MESATIPSRQDQSRFNNCGPSSRHKAPRFASATSCSFVQVHRHRGSIPSTPSRLATDLVVGYIDAYNRLDQSQINAFASVMPPHFSGVEQSLGVLRWIWNNFAAVAGDQPSFECWREFEQLDSRIFTDNFPQRLRKTGLCMKFSFRVGVCPLESCST